MEDKKTNTNSKLFKITVRGISLGLGAAAVLGLVSKGYGLVKDRQYEKAVLNNDTKIVSYEENFNYGDYLEKQLNIDFSNKMDDILNNQSITETLRYINEIRELNEYDELNAWQQKRFSEASKAIITNAPKIENLALTLGKEKLAEDLNIDLSKKDLEYLISSNTHDPGASIIIKNIKDSTPETTEVIPISKVDDKIGEYYSTIATLQSCKRINAEGKKDYTCTTNFNEFADIIEDVIAEMPIFAGYKFEAEKKEDGSIKKINQTGDILNITNTRLM